MNREIAVESVADLRVLKRIFENSRFPIFFRLGYRDEDIFSKNSLCIKYDGTDMWWAVPQALLVDIKHKSSLILPNWVQPAMADSDDLAREIRAGTHPYVFESNLHAGRGLYWRGIACTFSLKDLKFYREYEKFFTKKPDTIWVFEGEYVVNCYLSRF